MLPRRRHDLVQSFYMERLPYIDEHAITIDAGRADTWSALLRVMCRDPRDPSTVPVGFVLDEAATAGALRAEGPPLVRGLSVGVRAGRPRRRRANPAASGHLGGLPGHPWQDVSGARHRHGRAPRRRATDAETRCGVGPCRTRQTGEAAADYADIFEVPLAAGDARTAEQTFRDGLGDKPGAGGSLVAVDPPPRAEVAAGPGPLRRSSHRLADRSFGSRRAGAGDVRAADARRADAATPGRSARRPHHPRCTTAAETRRPDGLGARRPAAPGRGATADAAQRARRARARPFTAREAASNRGIAAR